MILGNFKHKYVSLSRMDNDKKSTNDDQPIPLNPNTTKRCEQGRFRGGWSNSTTSLSSDRHSSNPCLEGV